MQADSLHFMLMYWQVPLYFLSFLSVGSLWKYTHFGCFSLTLLPRVLSVQVVIRLCDPLPLQSELQSTPARRDFEDFWSNPFHFTGEETESQRSDWSKVTQLIGDREVWQTENWPWSQEDLVKSCLQHILAM